MYISMRDAEASESVRQGSLLEGLDEAKRRHPSGGGARPSRATPLVVDCDACAARDAEACSDCVVAFIVDREPGDAVVIDADEMRALRALARSGLSPELQFSPEPDAEVIEMPT